MMIVFCKDKKVSRFYSTSNLRTFTVSKTSTEKPEFDVAIVEKETGKYMYPPVRTYFEASAWKILGKNHTLIDAISFCSEHFVSENDDLTSKTF